MKIQSFLWSLLFLASSVHEGLSFPNPREASVRRQQRRQRVRGPILSRHQKLQVQIQEYQNQGHPRGKNRD